MAGSSPSVHFSEKKGRKEGGREADYNPFCARKKRRGRGDAGSRAFAKASYLPYTKERGRDKKEREKNNNLLLLKEYDDGGGKKRWCKE